MVKILVFILLKNVKTVSLHRTLNNNVFAGFRNLPIVKTYAGITSKVHTCCVKVIPSAVFSKLDKTVW